MFSRPSNRSGVAILSGERILKEAYSRLGISFQFLELPSERALMMANKGDTDGEFQRLAGLEQTYPNLMMISVPIGSVDIVVYTKETEFVVEDWQSLMPYTIGAVRGFKLVKTKTEGMSVEEVSNIKQAFLMLKLGRVDIVVDSISVQCDLKDFDPSGIRILQPPLERHVLYHYLHTRHSALAAKLEAVLTRMKQDGEIQTLQEQAMRDYLEMCRQ
ncbi:substrate-binding periplasmic protein [Desulfogranum japonicum]|uniref:substrate-binding periplasmic protein n=1 Tax=Desulfogranum japonicum TaxID=231447 RepID=UPI0013779880|nr:transporter substrate-binding domain-containing protein [Desulfogranum japonicum]